MPQSGQERRQRQRLVRWSSVGAALLVLAACSGCKLCGHSPAWTGGECHYAELIGQADAAHRTHVAACRAPADATSAIELASQANDLEAAGDPACVDLYFAATCRAWQDLAALGDRPGRYELIEQSPTYDACLAKLLVTAQRYQRFDATTGLTVVHQGTQLTIPVELYGFAWTADDFNQLELVGQYELTKHAKNVTMSGCGVPLVVVRRRPYDEQFFRPIQPFAATAVLRSRGPRAGKCSNDAACSDLEELVLEFYNPAHCTHLAGASKFWKLAGDLTAPLAWAKDLAPNDPISAFLRPDGVDAKPQLVMLEPYQPGKIPIVFVHGLLSDPTTWVTMGNALRNQAWFRERYQVWVFRYPSGTPFLGSAAILRRELNAAIASSPCASHDPAARHMVLVGHSMGGLVAKLQVTDSGDELWNLVANRPLDEIRASDDDRQRLREVFYFSPQPFVRRVIFMGTPHHGATLARRGIGRISSCLAGTTSEAEVRHRRLVAENPGVFQASVARHIPTSVDLLEPNNPLLTTMQRLTVSPCVQLHSIIGVAKLKHHSGPGDGVVSLTSATHGEVVSEKLVDATHEELHNSVASLAEIERILQLHLRAFDQQCDTPPIDPTVRRSSPTY